MTAPSSDKAAIRQTIRALIEAGYLLNEVDDGEEMVAVATEAEALAAITAVDIASLYVKSPDGLVTGWIYFVLGNDPEEVICDHSTNLAPVLDPLTKMWWER